MPASSRCARACPVRMALATRSCVGSSISMHTTGSAESACLRLCLPVSLITGSDISLPAMWRFYVGHMISVICRSEPVCLSRASQPIGTSGDRTGCEGCQRARGLHRKVCMTSG
jgi:hypothetical protein